MIIVECPFCEDEFEIHERYLTEDLDSVVCPICEAEVQLDEFMKEYREYKKERERIKQKRQTGRELRQGFSKRAEYLRAGLKMPKETAKRLLYYVRKGDTPSHVARVYKKSLLTAVHKSKRGGQLEKAAQGRLKRMRGEFWRGRREELKSKLKGLVRRLTGKKAPATVEPERQKAPTQPLFKPKALLTAG